MITLVLAEDHHFVRNKLRMLLDKEKDFSVIRQTDNGLEAVDLVNSHRPSVLVTDLMMPRLNGLEVAKRIRLNKLSTRIIMVTNKYSLPYVREAVKAGILGYLQKDMAADHLVTAVRTVLKNQRYIYPAVSDEELVETDTDNLEATLNAWEMLTRQEKEFLKFVATEKLDSKQISHSLLGSSGQFNQQRELMGKLGLHTYPELIAFLKKNKAS